MSDLSGEYPDNAGIWDSGAPAGLPVRREGDFHLKAMSALRSTAVLTAVSLFAQAVGFVYRVFLSRMVGSEVMGLYQLVLPVSSVLMSLTAVGFTVACSNLSAQYHALGNEKAAAQVVRQCVLGFLTAFTVVALITAPLSDWISVRLLGDARSRLGLLLLLPCVLLTGLENIHKHYFYGTGNVRPPAVTEICEQLIRTGAVLGLLWHFLPQSPERTVGLIVCGMVACEIFSAVTLSVLYRRAMGRHPAGEGAARRTLPRRIGLIALPIGWTSLLGNLMGAATSVMIPQRLVRAGADVSQAMSAFGVMCGMTVPMLALPTAVISAMSLVLVPRLAESAALGRPDLARRRTGKALEATSLLILPASALLAVLAPALARMLFREPSAGDFAAPLSVGVALTCYEAVLGASLNGLGRQTASARNALISGAVQLLITWARMGQSGVGLHGYVEGLLVSTVLGVFFNWRSLHRAINLKFQFFRWIAAPGLAALLAGLCVNLLFPILTGAGMGEVPACLACFAFGVVLYLCTLAAQGVVSRPCAAAKKEVS